jgi:hypothetical protein
MDSDDVEAGYQMPPMVDSGDAEADYQRPLVADFGDVEAGSQRPLVVGGTDRRCARRFYLGMTASLRVFNSSQSYFAFIRDCSCAGIFFYSAWAPTVGSDVEIALEAPQLRVKCTGRVVRVERTAGAAVTGVAVLAERYEMLRYPTKPN